MSLTSQHTDSLLGLCKQGNQLAQLEIYNRYQKAMYNTALRIVKDPFEAEDVMQESFIKAFDKLESFKGDASFGSWLKRIVINNGIGVYKKQQRFTDVPLDSVAHEQAPETDGISEMDYSALKATEVMQQMNSLKDNYRQVLSLYLIEGYDHEEICEIMDISYANCRTLISRAKESLRNKLK
ncbi:MAG: RNA polymerase sigma factor [Gilvibacter sp.]